MVALIVRPNLQKLVWYVSMIDIQARPDLRFLKCEFDAFLYAPIGLERIGGELTVVSALARLGVDPWEEAEMLSHLSEESAANRLSSLIARYPDLMFEAGERSRLAKSLIALLPHQRRSLVSRRVQTGDKRRIVAVRSIPSYFLISALMLLAVEIVYFSNGGFDSNNTSSSSDTSLPLVKPPAQTSSR